MFLAFIKNSISSSQPQSYNLVKCFLSNSSSSVELNSKGWPSKPSSPYKNCMIAPLASLTLPSHSVLHVSIALTNLLCIYPVTAVLIAVLISPSLPTIAEKKNSYGVIPFIYGLLTIPRAWGEVSPALKHGNVLPAIDASILLPPLFC